MFLEYPKGRLKLSTILLISSLAVAGSACGADDTSTPEPATSAAALNESKPALAKDFEKAQKTEHKPGIHAAGFMENWDITPASAKATSLGLDANIELSRDGQLALHSIPSYGIDGIAKVPKSPYILDNPLFGREGNLQPLKAPVAHFNAKTVRYEYPGSGLSAIYERRPQGLEQLFEVQHSLPGKGNLVLKYETPAEFEHKLNADDDTILVTLEDQKHMRISKLIVRDAKGELVPSQLFVEKGHFGYAIDDRGAAYPLDIDPIFDNPSTVLEGENAEAQFGYIVKNAGDLNGDGFADIAIGEPDYSNGEGFEGRMVIFLGSLSGLSATASIAIESDLLWAGMGSAIEPLGDINGDGFNNLAVSLPYVDNLTGQVLIFEGKSTLGFTDPALDVPAALQIDGNSIQSMFGYSIASGDINCDGKTDLVIGAYKNSMAFAFYGDGNTFSSTPDWTVTSTSSSNFGLDITSGNLNNDPDACDDVAISSPYWNSQFANFSGRVEVFYGGQSGLSTTADWTFEGAQASSYHGISLTTGDFNGDGIDELVLSAQLFDSATLNDSGRVYIFHGPLGDPVTDRTVLNGYRENENFGSFVSNAGDINGDGYDDLLIGAYKHTDILSEQGAAYLFFGSSTRISESDTPAWIGMG